MTTGTVSKGGLRIPLSRHFGQAARAGCVLGSILVIACGSPQEEAQRRAAVDDERFAAARGLHLARRGTITAEFLTPGGDDKVALEISLRAPWSPVEDTDIRGYLDGTVKYEFNQGTAYHMRLGRRYGGYYRNRSELKRSLVKWHLPSWRNDVSVVDAAMTLYVERFLADSPLSTGQVPLPLYVMVYPVLQDWREGNGGTDFDSFSDAAVGEVSWLAASQATEAWEAPGALTVHETNGAAPYAVMPLGLGMIDCSDCRVEVRGEALTEAVAEALSKGEAFDTLLKLDDAQEDQWGTEVGILTSDFGHDWDQTNKRPELGLIIEARGKRRRMVREVILEPGGELQLPPTTHTERPVLLSASFQRPDRSAANVSPTIWIRGGTGEFDSSAPWEPLLNPIEKDWAWSQMKVSGRPHQVDWGEVISWRIRETWVRPKPRDRVVPALYLVSPTGKQRKILGEPVSDLYYEMRFSPREFGLWRYAWSFQPVPEAEPDTHAGEGLFYVAARGPRSVRAAAKHLVDAIRQGGVERHRMEAEVLVREAARNRPRVEWSGTSPDIWLDCVREVLADPGTDDAATCSTLAADVDQPVARSTSSE